MEIQVNNQYKEIAADYTLQKLLDEFIGKEQNGIAVAVNDTVIPKAFWDQHFICLNDDVLIIKAAQGG